ncbi:MAG: hypothetical protein ABIQ44_15600, partial [Chloroflexia bacterium]
MDPPAIVSSKTIAPTDGDNMQPQSQTPYSKGRQRAALFLVLLLAFLVRLPSLLTGYPNSQDVRDYEQWGEIIKQSGFPSAYQNPAIDYPPILVYVIGATAIAEEHLGAWDANPRPDHSLVAFVLQILTTLTDLLTAALLALIFLPRSTRLAILVAALYSFNPVILYITTVWGQTDSVYVLPLLASIVALERRAILPAWLLYTLAVATKIQSIALAPLFLTWTLARHGLRGLIAGISIGAATFAVICGPWLLSGNLSGLLRPFIAPGEGRIDVSGYNLWYLVTLGNLRLKSSLQPFGLPITYQLIGDILFFLFACLISYMAVRRNNGLALPSAILSLGMFMLMTDIHERHAYPAIAFLLYYAAERTVNRSTQSAQPTRDPRAAWVAYALVTTTIFFN